MILLYLSYLDDDRRTKRFENLQRFRQAHVWRRSYANAFFRALEAKIQDVIHILRFAEVGTCDELRLLGSRSGHICEDGVAELYPYLANFAILAYVDNETNLAVISVAGLLP
jgi:hypothetical protein